MSKSSGNQETKKKKESGENPPKKERREESKSERIPSDALKSVHLWEKTILWPVGSWLIPIAEPKSRTESFEQENHHRHLRFLRKQESLLGLREHTVDLAWIFANEYPSHWIAALWIVSLEVPRTEMVSLYQESPRQTKPKKGQNEKFMNFAHFREFWCFSLGKQARFTLNFCSGMPLRKVHELTFFWFGLPGPLLIISLSWSA